MEPKKNTSSEKEGNDSNKDPYLSSNVKDILKRRREDKNKKSKRKMNLSAILPENLEIDTGNTINDNENDNENEDVKMIDDNEKNNKDIKEMEKKAKESYKSIYNKHNNLDINFNTNINKSKENIKNNKNNIITTCCKESFFLIINIISFVLFFLSFNKRSNNDIIYYYFIYPINKISLILLLISASLTSIIIILVKINQISIFHLCYSVTYYMLMYFKYHLTNDNINSINYFDTANSYYFIYFIIMIHTLGIIFILYNIAYYFYLSGQFSKNENNLYGLLIDYWESERKIKKLEKYININLDQLITSKGYSHEENIINKKKNSKVIWRIIILGALLLLIHILLIFKKSEVFNCDYFNDNSNIIDEDKYCQISKPKGYCYMNALTGYFDTFTDMNKCNLGRNPQNEKENLLKSLKHTNNKISENTKIFGFPLTNNKDFYFNELGDYNSINNNITLLEEKVNQEIFDLETNPKGNPEAVIDFSDENNPKLKINLKYNEELSNQRKGTESKESLFKNVFVVYLSGVSQFYFKKVLPKLSSFITKFSKTSVDNDNQMSMNSYQFTRYHSFSNDSFYNYFYMFYDSSFNSNQNTLKSNLNSDQNININDHLKYFKENGYITGQSIDSCNNFEHQFKNNRDTFWDHENLAISCDKNYLNNIKNNNYCLYGNPFYTYHINYAMQFWEKYKDNKKYFRLNFNTPNEKSGSLLSYLDQPLYDLFIKFSFNGLLDDTAVFFVSEFGGVQDNILYNFGINNEKEINMKMGSFFLLLNKNNKLSNDENKMIYNNQNKMLSSFDIYATLTHIAMGSNINKIKLYLDEDNRGESIFRIIDGNERNCNFYKNYWIDEEFCVCLKNE